MKPEDFDEKEVADSLQAAASRLGVPLELVKQSKREGSRAFRGSRIYLKLLAQEIAIIDEPDTVPFTFRQARIATRKLSKRSRSCYE